MLVAVAAALASEELDDMLDLTRQLLAEHEESKRLASFNGRLHASDVDLLQRNIDDPDLVSLVRALKFVLDGHLPKT